MDLIPVDEATSNIEQLVGLFLTGLSGLSARCGSRDMAMPRPIDKAVFEMARRDIPILHQAGGRTQRAAG